MFSVYSNSFIMKSVQCTENAAFMSFLDSYGLTDFCVLFSDGLPGANDLFHAPPCWTRTLLFIFRVYRVDTALWRDVNFDLEKTGDTKKWWLFKIN